MLTRKIAIPFAIALVVFMFLAFYNPYLYRFYVVPPMIALAILYVLHPKIDWWWAQKHPPKLEKKGLQMLQKFSPFFQQLNNENKQKFLDRLVLIRMAKDFLSQAEDKAVPPDFRTVFAATQAQLTLGLSDYLLKKHEKVVVYPGDFPSPKYPEHFHISENFEEETVNGYIFSMEHALAAFFDPKQYYNIIMHELAQSLIETYPQMPWPIADERIWPKLEQISHFPTQKLLETMNRPDFEPLAAMVTHYMVFPKRFQEVLPEQFQQLQQLLKV